MNKRGFIGIFVVFLLLMLAVVVIVRLPRTEHKYEYVGTIIDMEGGTSSSVLILELDTIGKTPYTTQKRCSNKIRVGQKVYWKNNGNYLWVKYAEDKYC